MTYRRPTMLNREKGERFVWLKRKVIIRCYGIHFPSVLIRDRASHNRFIRLIAYDQRIYLVIRTEDVPEAPKIGSPKKQNLR